MSLKLTKPQADIKTNRAAIMERRHTAIYTHLRIVNAYTFLQKKLQIKKFEWGLPGISLKQDIFYIFWCRKSYLI